MKRQLEGLLQATNVYSFISSVKGIPAYWKQFLYDALTMVKQIGIPTYLLSFSWANLKLEELPYIIKKLNNLGLRNLGGTKKFKLSRTVWLVKL